MSKTYKIRVNESGASDGQTISVTQGVGDKGAPVRVIAQRGARYELQDDAKAKGAAPDQVRVKRMGKNLNLMFDGSQKPDVVLENFYAVASPGDGGLPVLAGLAENGSVYAYIPQDPALSSVTAALADGNTPVLMALGGGALGETFALAALPLVASAATAGGVSGWAVAGGALGAAALAGGGGGGAAAVLPRANNIASITLKNPEPIEVSNSTNFSNTNAAVTVTDTDPKETAIQGLATTGNTQSVGALGVLTTTGDGQGKYGFSYENKTSTPSADTTQHDLFSFTSIDATANRTLDFVITAPGATKQEFNVAPLGSERVVKGLKATGSSLTTDTVKLNGSSTGEQTSFDFSDPAIATFESIEKIEILGTGPNTVRLSLASLTQGDTTGAQTQKLWITGDANDALYFTSPTAAVNGGLVTVDGVQFQSYVFGNDELLVQTAITSITFNS